MRADKQADKRTSVELSEVEAGVLLSGLLELVERYKEVGEDITDDCPGLDFDDLLTRLQDASGRRYRWLSAISN